MAPSTPHQLSDGDAVFLSMETARSSGHVGALMVLDPSTAPEGFDFDRVVEHVTARVGLIPRFGWKVQEVPLGLDRPYWVEDPDFEIRDHVIRTAIPAPGTRRELNALAARLHAQPLDPTRPLWQVWCIEGLEGGKFALYMKTHHCLVDGSGGAGLSEVLADLSPRSEGPIAGADAYQEAAPVAPRRFDVLTRAVRNGIDRRVKTVGHARRGLASLWRGSREEREGAVGDVPVLPFNDVVSRDRVLGTAVLDLERVRSLKKRFDVTVNDVVLALSGSAVRRWLRERDALPADAAVAMCPVSTRGDARGLGNEISSMSVSLATDIADPVARLRAIHASSIVAKETVEAGSFDVLAAVGECMAPALARLALMGAESAPTAVPLPGNFVVSNVRSAPMPLYLAGARIETMIPLSLLQAGMGLNVTVISYCDRIDVGIVADPQLVPDVQELASDFERALDELELAAEGVAHRAA